MAVYSAFTGQKVSGSDVSDGGVKPQAVATQAAQVKTDSEIIPAPANNSQEPIRNYGVDYSLFEANNWLKTDANATLNEINKRGAAVWLTASGELSFRLSVDEKVQTQPATRAAKVFSNLLSKKITVLKDGADISELDLKLIAKEEFLPHSLSEFADYAGLTLRNLFKPSIYLQTKPEYTREPKAILSLIAHLANNNEERTTYILNWLAGFFQGLRKSQVALVLRGDQGAGKGVLFKEVIAPLFGSGYAIQVNDKALEGNFIGSIVENKLFFNLDEISHNMAGRKEKKNFLKQLVTNDSISAEKKNINLEKETRLYGQVLVTSNEPYVLEIETTDRRYTVYQTGGNLSLNGFLGYGSYGRLSEAIQSELMEFAGYLKAYKVDWKLFNTAQDTPEKAALIQATNDKYTLFIEAVKTKNILFFDTMSETLLYKELEADFAKNRICQQSVTKLFNGVFELDGKDEVKSKTLLNALRAREPHLFDDKNRTKSNGNGYYQLEPKNGQIQ